VPAARLTGGPGSLVGGWVFGTPSLNNSSALLVFLQDGKYLYAQDDIQASDGSSGDGIESGGYSWNSQTGAFLAVATVNTDGITGLSHLPGGTLARLSTDLRSLTIQAGQLSVAERIPEPDLPAGPLAVNAWNLTQIGWVYGYTPLWGYSVFMGNVYFGDLPWIYQVPFGYLYLANAATVPAAGGGTTYWFYSATLGWVYASDAEGGWFRNESSGWSWNNFLNPVP
jgi:hypothetical protein